jgi:leucyl-tRNA synthetase
MPCYNYRDVEPRWRQRWAEAGSTALSPEEAQGKPKVLRARDIPYPSRASTSATRATTRWATSSRSKRAKGFNVLHPMGCTHSGFQVRTPPSSAACIRRTDSENIVAMKQQLKLLGIAVDWSREFAWCDPALYMHRQALFLAFLRKNLVRKKAKVNWEPGDMTVLANEQVVDSTGWRSAAPVERR